MKNKKIMFGIAAISAALVVGASISLTNTLVPTKAEEKLCNFTIVENDFTSVANVSNDTAKNFALRTLELEAMNVVSSKETSNRNTLMYNYSSKTPYIATSGKAYDDAEKLGGQVNGLNSITFAWQKLGVVSPVATKLSFELKVWNSYDEASTAKTYNIVEKQLTEPNTKDEFTQTFDDLEVKPNMFKLSFTGGKKDLMGNPNPRPGSDVLRTAFIVPLSLSIDCTTLDAEVSKTTTIAGTSKWVSAGKNAVKVTEGNVDLTYNGIQPNYQLTFANRVVAGAVRMDANITLNTKVNDLNKVEINAFVRNETYQPTTAKVNFFNDDALVHSTDALNIPVSVDGNNVNNLVFALPQDKVANTFEIVFDYSNTGGTTILLNSYSFDYFVIAK